MCHYLSLAIEPSRWAEVFDGSSDSVKHDPTAIAFAPFGSDDPTDGDLLLFLVLNTLTLL